MWRAMRRPRFVSDEIFWAAYSDGQNPWENPEYNFICLIFNCTDNIERCVCARFDGTVAPSYSHARAHASHFSLHLAPVACFRTSSVHIGAIRIPDVEERERQWRTRCKFFACDFVNRSTRVEDCTAKRSWFGSRAIQFFLFVCIMQWILISVLNEKKKLKYFFVLFSLLRFGTAEREFAINYSRCVVVFGRRTHPSIRPMAE